MRRVLFFLVLIFLLVAGGGLTSFFASQEDGFKLPGTVEQVDDAEASVFTATTWQAQQFVLFVGFLLFNLVGIGVTLAVIVWLLSRQIARAKAAEAPATTGTEIEPAPARDLA